MKLSVVLSSAAIVGCFATVASAFSPSAPQVSPRTGHVSLCASSSGESQDRRAFLVSSAAAASAAAAFFATTANPSPARAYRQEWLTEPTQEFLDNEAKAAEFKRQQILVKKEFNELIAHFTTVSKTEEELRDDLVALTRLIAKTGGLPAGLKKEDLYKQIRTIKAKGFWPTSVEVAYQDLKLEVGFQQSPNKDKEMGRF